MRTLIIGLIMAGLFSVTGQTKSAAKKPAASTPQGLPAGAEKVGDGTWKWKDPQGKSWIYHSTPFGYTRNEDVPEKAAAPPTGLHVIGVKNGQVTFELETPFGKSRRVRAVSELSGDEKAAYEVHLKTASSDQSAK